MIPRLAALALFSLALPAGAQSARPLRIHGHVELPAGCPEGGPIEILARQGEARAPLSGATLAWTQVDADGDFELALELHGPGFLLALSARWLELPPLWIEPRPGESAIEIVLLPALRGILHGSLVSPAAGPVAARALSGSWAWIEGAQLHASAVDVDGEFELCGSAADMGGALCVRPHGYAPLFADAGAIRDGEQTELVLQLVLPARLRGRIVDSHRAGVAGVTLTFWHGSPVQQPLLVDPWGELQTSTSGADGQFDADLLPPGDLTLRLEDPRGRLLGAEVRGLRAGEERAGLELVLLRSASLRGVVVDESGQPIAGARVTAGMREGLGGMLVAASDAQGRYAFDAALPGEYVLSASSEARAAHSAGIVALLEGDRQRADLVLRRGCALRIDVQEHEAPVRVRLTDALGFLRADQRVWQGELALTLPPGIYRVGLVARDGTCRECRLVLTGRERRPCEFWL